MQYRKEIDGLRTLAILPVIFFHAGFDFFSGGYIGVDIFFVISGYLITSIILREKEAGTFSIAHFYERRIRRIFPALFFVMLCCLPFAYFTMLPGTLIEFGESLIATSSFTSNILFWLRTGYFETSAELKPLLHTWSLSVEEQYYLIFPLFIMLFWKTGRRVILPILALGFIISIGMAEWGWRNHSSANFFLTPSRIWELLTGVFVAFYLFYKNDSANKPYLALIGLITVLLTIVFFDQSTPFPSLYTLIPVLGTALIILYARSDNLTGKILSLPIMVGIGLISYSAYLWHQPLFAFTRIMYQPDLSGVIYIGLSALTLLLAYLTWRFVENPIRFNKNITRGKVFAGGTLATLVMILLGGIILLTDGFKTRYPAEDQYLISLSPARAQAYVTSTYRKYANKNFKTGGKPKILVIGDSYSQDFSNALYEAGIIENIQLSTHYIASRCGVVYAYDTESVLKHIAPNDHKQCKIDGWFESKSLQARLKQADHVFIAASWSPWEIDALPRTIENIKSATEAKLTIVGRKNFGHINIMKLLKRSAEERKTLRLDTTEEHLSVNDKMKEIIPRDMFLDQHQMICGESDTCPTFTPDGKLISYDGGHLTQEGAVYVGELLKEQLF